MNGHWWSVAAVWVATIAAAVVVGAVQRPAAVLAALPLVLAGAVVVAFAVQLVVADRIGFVHRLTASASGAFAIVLVGGLVAALR